MNVENIFEIDELCDGGYVTADYVQVSKEEYNKVKDISVSDIACVCSPPIQYLYRDSEYKDISGKAYLYESERRPETIDRENEYFLLKTTEKPYKMVTIMKSGLTREQRLEYRERISSDYYKRDKIENVL